MSRFNCKIPMLFIICLSLSQVVHSASDNEKENTSAADSLFGKKEEPKKADDAPLWSTKSDFISAASSGQMSAYKGDRDIKVLNSLRIILANDYKTPVPEPKNDGGNSMLCNDTFDLAADSLVSHITEVSMARISDTPPDFTGAPPENANEIGRNIFQNFYFNCSQEVLGKNKPYPFVNSLAALMKEYSDATDSYANKLQQEKIVEYNQSLIKESEQKAKIAAAEEKLILSKQANAEFEKTERARMASCKSSVAYKRYASSYDVNYNLETAQNARQAIEKENEAGKVSGYVNSANLNKLGRLVVFHEDRANTSYAEYRKNGGTANSAKRVEVPENPCQ